MKTTTRHALLLAAAALMLPTAPAFAQADTVKIGLDPAADRTVRVDGAADRGRRAALHGSRTASTVAGKKIELIVKDDTGTPDIAKRLAQELVNDKAAMLAGFGLTPIAMAVAPIATQAKVPEVVMAAGTSTITEASPYVVRTSFTVAQSVVPMAEWAAKNGVKKVVTIVSDYAPGFDAEKVFSETLHEGRRQGRQRPRAAAQPGLRAFPAARRRRKARRAVRVRALRRGDAADEAVCRSAASTSPASS
mgnify:CR=1 FL=1